MNNICTLTRFKRTNFQTQNANKTVRCYSGRQQRIQRVVYLAHTLDDLGEFVLNFQEEVEEFLRQLCDETYTNRYT